MDLSGSPSKSPVSPKRKRRQAEPIPVEDSSAQQCQRLGRYVVTGQLGRGGMGIVYEAEDTLLQRKVAIKLLPKDVSANPEALARFLREAQGAARLNHANVVAVYDIGEADGTHYIVMELIKGGNAQDILRHRGPFHWLEATSILMDVCRGVAAAHKAGLIHRDIKPANILRSTDGVVKLADFGLVKPAGVKGAVVTALGEVVGTPHYMSPEQSRCAALDERSDIYSLGATYYALLTGRPPFNATDSMQVLFAHCAHPVPDPREIVRSIPAMCTAIIRKAMAKDRAQRHRSAGELLGELEQVLALMPEKSSASTIDAPQPPFVWSRAHPSETTNPLSLPTAYPGERTGPGNTRKSHRWKTIALSLVCLLLISALVGLLRDAGKRPITIPQPDLSALDKDDWPTLATEADQAIRSRSALAMKKSLADILVLQKRASMTDPTQQDSIRQTVERLEKALAFRESITEKGLVLGLEGQVTSVQISPDGHRLAIGQSHGSSGAIVLDCYTGEKLHSLWPLRNKLMVRVQGLAFSHDGTVLAASCADDTIKLANLGTAKEWSLDLGPDVNRALSLAFSPTTRNLVASLEPSGDSEGKGKPYLKSWNVDTGLERFLFKAEHSAKVWSVAYCAGGHQVATGSQDKRVVIWNAETGRIWRELRTGIAIRAIACSPHGGTMAVAGQDQDSSVLQFWDYAAENLLVTKPSLHGPCRCVAFSRNGKLVASGSGSRVLLWDAETHALLASLTGHSQDVTSLTFTVDGGILVSGGLDQTIRLWDVTRDVATRPKP